ncbi:GNAT family N-acetyltransferase [Kordiimonas marina]|uniref:GNAT family N-acetyltransferase n=1 Tax=Kordiimonas marina TaxID=2872312 RepID=UPI001FF1E55B|nr:GNAT family N-acetyltransferase [Kordiimonas marina]MCJ9429240.1 GNAT family N-acetyltransferase [Kordiimonas marina]
MLETDRLILRQWRAEDRAPFAAMNADAEVMRFFPAPQTRAESDASVARQEKRIAERGYGLWAAELKETGAFIGFIGVQDAPYEVPCAPAWEIGWRLDKAHWGQGLAPEGARAVLAYAFSALKAEEVVAFTAEINLPSRRVMEKIGMTYDAEGDFKHPAVPIRHPVRPHVLYRIKAEDLA